MDPSSDAFGARLLDMALEDGAPRAPLSGLFPNHLPLPSLEDALVPIAAASQLSHLHPTTLQDPNPWAKAWTMVRRGTAMQTCRANPNPNPNPSPNPNPNPNPAHVEELTWDGLAEAVGGNCPGCTDVPKVPGKTYLHGNGVLGLCSCCSNGLKEVLGGTLPASAPEMRSTLNAMVFRSICLELPMNILDRMSGEELLSAFAAAALAAPAALAAARCRVTRRASCQQRRLPRGHLAGGPLGLDQN